MPATYEPIATLTFNGTAIEGSFTSIPSSYTDLRLVFVGTSSGTQSMNLQFNGDTGTNYSRTAITGDGSSVSSSRNTSIARIIVGQTQTTPELITADIFNYAGSTNKTLLAESSRDLNGSGAVNRLVALWRNTAAITSIRLFTVDVNNITGTATLYGILRA